MISRATSRLFASLLTTAVMAPLLAHCSSDEPDGAGDCVGVNCEPFDGSPPDQFVHDATLADGTADDAATGPRNPLCGPPASCSPDEPSSCASFTPTALDASALDASAADASIYADAALADVGVETDAMLPDDGSTGEGGAGGADGGGAPRGCEVRAGSEGPEATCSPVGNGGVAAPCETSRDCAAGLACVGDDDQGECRPYCCRGAGVCANDSFCRERRLHEQPDSGPAVRVPVCVVADQCDLAEEYPCPAGLRARGSCTCPENTACKVVRDGLTSCIEPGQGKAGDDCPCAWNHICSQATRKCLKLCSTVGSEPECASGRCQATADLPKDFGICVLE